MPKLVDWTSLGGNGPATSERPMSSIETNAFEQGVDALGRGLRSMGDSFSRVVESNANKERQIGAANADAYVLRQRDAFLERMRENPENFSNWEKEYTTNAQRWQEEAGKLIPDGAARQLWQARNQSFLEQNRANVAKQAFETGRKSYMDFNNQVINEFQDKYLTASDPDKAVYRQTVDGMIDDYVARGYLNPGQAAQAKKDWAQGTAIRWVQMLPADERVAILSGGAASVGAPQNSQTTAPATDTRTQQSPAQRASLGAYIQAREGVNTQGIVPDVQRRVAALQEQAKAAGIPFEVVSGHRDPDRNARVGGARNSQHIHGTAVDIKLPQDPEKARQLVQMLADSGVPGFGYYPNSRSIHIDYRNTGPATWGQSRRSDSVGQGGDPEIWRIIQSRNVAPGSVPAARTGTIADAIPADKRVELLRRAEAEVERDRRAAMVETRANVQIAERDANAAYLTGRMDFTGAPTREQFIAAYGPEEGARRAMAMEMNRQTGDAILRFQTMKPDDIMREVTAAQQAVAAAPGMVENAQRVGVLQKAAQEVLKRREDDPVAEAIRHNPAATRAYEAFSQAMQSGDAAAIKVAAGAWAGVSRETLGQMGIASANIVPKTYAQTVANNIRQLAGEGKLQEAHAQLMQQMDMWGADWKQVQGQLIQAGLPGVVMVASTMNRPDQRRAAGELMEAVTTGRKEFEKVLGEGVLKEIKEAAEKNNLAMDRTFASSPNSTATSLAIKESIEMLAMRYTRQGDTPAKAAERAYQDIIGKKYHPITLGQTYRIPAETNLPKVRFGMAATLERLDKMGIDPPQTMLRGMRPEDVSKQYLAAIRANHRWITNGDESGLVMLDQWGAPVMRGGKPLSMTWKELEEADASGPNVRINPPGERGDVLPRAIMRPMPRGPAPLQ